jgi:hypothetical protein
MDYRLSKSKYLRGLNCLKCLWLTIYARDKEAPPSPATAYRFEQGIAVGLKAQELFPEGRIVQTPSYAADRALRETRAALGAGAPALFEAAFFHDNTLVRVDVLRGLGRGEWELIEVKSTTSVKPEHIPDLAVQRHVLEGCGLRVPRAVLMHLNPQCEYPHLEELFVQEEINAEVQGEQLRVPEMLERFRQTLSASTEPAVPVGPHCEEPYECPFKGYCWQGVPPVSIFDIPRLGSAAKGQLAAQGVLRLEDLPAEYPLTENQARFVKLIRRGRAQIDSASIRVLLATLSFPLYFLDFETDSPAIPRFPGMRPFQQFPFQFSVHVLQPGGRLEHREYLHGDLEDPRPALARRLVEAIGPEGSIVAYNAAFERGVLEALARELPSLAEDLLQRAARLWDLLPVFREHYLHPGFGGSASIKRVLPVLVPELSYEDLEIGEGAQAQAAWNRLVFLEECEERSRLSEALLEYCRLDTGAMVEIYRVLSRL